MDGQVQTVSFQERIGVPVVLWNCGHSVMRKLIYSVNNPNYDGKYFQDLVG